MLSSIAKWAVVQRRGLIVVAAFLVMAELLGLQSLRDELAGMRPANRDELFYSYMAQKLNAPALCRKIPWAAQAGPGIDFAAEYVRSNCYETIAGNTENPWLCWRVKRLGAVSVWRHQTSMWSCVGQAWRHERVGSGVAPGELAQYFQKMGYDPDTLQTEGVTPALVQVKDIYRGLTARVGLRMRSRVEGGDAPTVTPGSVAQAVLLTRLVGLIGPIDAPLVMKRGDAVDGAYLADLAAMSSMEWGWCEKIPAEMPLATERAGFRNWCVFKVANETNTIALCKRLTDPAGTAPWDSLPGLCRAQIDSPYPRTMHYAPEVPGDDARTRRLLGMLGVEIPTAKDLPKEAIYQAYWEFLDELDGRKKDAAHVTARQRLIARVEALPAQ